MEIRIMTITDYDGVYDLWDNTPEMGINSTDDSREGIRKYLERNPVTSFVAVENGRIVGAILAGHDGRRGFIQHITVAADCRHQGIAAKLVDAAMAALEQEGIHKVALLTYQKNQVGNAFWEQLGFAVRDDLNYRNLALTDMIRYDPEYN